MKARKLADRERLMFWFNVRFTCRGGMRDAELAFRADRDAHRLTA